MTEDARSEEIHDNPFPDDLWAVIHRNPPSYLACTPFCRYGNLGAQLTPEFFFKSLFTGTPRGTTQAKRIAQIHSDTSISTSKIIKVVGDRGCGKSTLVHHAFQVKSQARDKDNPWNPEDYCYTIDFEDNLVTAGIHELSAVNPDADAADGKRTFQRFIAAHLLNTPAHAQAPIYQLWDFFRPADRLHTDALKKFAEGPELTTFFDSVPFATAGSALAPLSEEDIYTHTEAFTFLEFVLLSGLTILSDAATRTNKDDIFILFDNIDCFGPDEAATEVFRAITALPRFFTEFIPTYVAGSSCAHLIGDLVDRVRFIVCMRETTQGLITSRFGEQSRWLPDYIPASRIYNMDEVLGTRIDLLRKGYLHDGSPHAQVAKDLQLLMRIPNLSQSILDLFNGNQRVFAYILAHCMSNFATPLHIAAEEIRKFTPPPREEPPPGERIIQTPIDALTPQDRARTYLARGAMVRLVIEQLSLIQYLGLQDVPRSTQRLALRSGVEPLTSQQQHTTVVDTPLPIIVLLYLANVRQGLIDDAQYGRNGVSLDQLMTYFVPFFSDELTGLETLVDVLWQLYWRDSPDSNVWARLIRIDGLGEAGKSQLIDAALDFCTKQTNISTKLNPRVYISDAGNAVITFMLSNYEFVAWLSGHVEDALLQQVATRDVAAIRRSIDTTIPSMKRFLKTLSQTTDICIDDESFDGAGREHPSSYAFVITTLWTGMCQYFTEYAIYAYLRAIDTARRLLCFNAEGNSTAIKEICDSLIEAELNVTKLFRGGGPDGILQLRPDRLIRLETHQTRLHAIQADPADMWQIDAFDW